MVLVIAHLSKARRFSSKRKLRHRSRQLRHYEAFFEVCHLKYHQAYI